MSEVEQLRSDVKSLQEMMAKLMTQMAGNSGNLSLSMASGQSDKNTSETEEETEHGGMGGLLTGDNVLGVLDLGTLIGRA